MSKIVAGVATVALLVVAGGLIHRQMQHHHHSSAAAAATTKKDPKAMNPAELSAYCYEHTTCSGCTTASSGVCGFCETTGQCLPGGANGPTDSGCPAWNWLQSDCKSCAQYSGYGCDTCSQQAGCGWCNNGYNGYSGCMSGNSTGPNRNAYCSTWKWSYYGSCEAPVADCGQFSDCATCTSAPSGTCGFCATTKTCSQGNSYGPTNGAYCSGSWEWYNNQCSNEEATANTVDEKKKSA
jgi:hypothetical protein